MAQRGTESLSSVIERKWSHHSSSLGSSLPSTLTMGGTHSKVGLWEPDTVQGKRISHWGPLVTCRSVSTMVTVGHHHRCPSGKWGQSCKITHLDQMLPKLTTQLTDFWTLPSAWEAQWSERQLSCEHQGESSLPGVGSAALAA